MRFRFLYSSRLPVLIKLWLMGLVEESFSKGAHFSLFKKLVLLLVRPPAASPRYRQRWGVRAHRGASPVAFPARWAKAKTEHLSTLMLC